MRTLSRLFSARNFGALALGANLLAVLSAAAQTDERKSPVLKAADVLTKENMEACLADFAAGKNIVTMPDRDAPGSVGDTYSRTARGIYCFSVERATEAATGDDLYASVHFMFSPPGSSGRLNGDYVSVNASREMVIDRGELSHYEKITIEYPSADASKYYRSNESFIMARQEPGGDRRYFSICDAQNKDCQMYVGAKAYSEIAETFSEADKEVDKEIHVVASAAIERASIAFFTVAMKNRQIGATPK